MSHISSLSFRRFVRSRLFATTALISLAGLPGVARADMGLDLSLIGEGWSSSREIWMDENGDHGRLPDDETGVITITGNPSPVTDMRVIGTVTAAGLRLDGGSFRLRRDNFLSELRANGSGPLEFWVGGASDVPDVQNELLLGLNIDGDVHILGPGTAPSQGAVVLEQDRELDGDVTNDGIFSLRRGTVTGDLTNNRQLNLAGTVEGQVDNHGLTFVTANSSADAWVNQSDGRMVIQSGANLTVDNALENSGRLRLQDGTLRAGLTNDSELIGWGTITGAVQNNATGIITTEQGTLNLNGLTNDGTVIVAAGTTLNNNGGPVRNNLQLNLDGALTGGLNNAATGTVDMGSDASIAGGVTNNGTMNAAGLITGTLTNNNILNTSGNLQVGQIDNDGTLNIGADHEVQASQTVLNSNVTNIAGTLIGNITNQTGGALNLTGGTINGTVENNAVMTADGRVNGTVNNNATLNVDNSLQVEVLNNSGTTTVDAGETLTATQRIDNNAQLNISGTVNVDGTAGILNNGGGTVTLDGAAINGNVTNNGEIAVDSSSQITGDLTNNTLMTMDGSGQNVTLTVDGVFTNSGTVNGISDVEGRQTIVATYYWNNGGITNNVNVVGDFLNRGMVNYDQDSSISGNMRNDPEGVVNVSAALDMTGHDFDNRGNLHITTDPDSVGALNNVGALLNQGTATIDAGTSATADSVRNHGDGEMNVAGTLTSVEAVENEADLTVSGQIVAGLDNSGSTTLAGGTVTGAVTNSGTLQGNGTLSSTVTNSGTMAMTGTVAGVVTNNSTLTQNGALSVAGLVNNEIATIAAGGVLTSADTVQNNDRLSVAGRLEGAVQNNTDGRMVLNGGTVTGAVSNAGQLTGSGTVSGALTNSGTAELSGVLAGGVTNTATGVLQSQGTLRTASLVNDGRVEVASGTTLQSDMAVQNRNALIVAGQLTADLTNTGTTTLSGGTITGAVINDNQLTGTGTIAGALTNNGSANIGGQVSGAVVNAGTLTSRGTLRVGSLVNDEVLNVVTGSTLRSDGTITNNDRATLAGRVEGTLNNTGTTTLAGGTLAGQLNNSGTLTGTGTVNGTLANAGTATIAGQVSRLENAGTLDLSGDLRVGRLVNAGLASVGAGRRLSVENGLLNNDRLVLAGTMAGQLQNTGAATLDGGRIEGAVSNTGTLTGGGTITGQVVNDGTLTTDRNLTIAQLINNQTVTVAETGVLSSANPVQNAGALNLSGRLQADLLNRAGGRATLTGGTVNGDIANEGRLTGTGTVEGTVQNAGTANLGGQVEALHNLEGGEFGVVGTLTTDEFQNAGRATIGAGTELATTDPARNLATGALAVNGTLRGALVNAGQLSGGGTITGAVLNTGSADWAGTIQGAVSNRADLTLAGTIAGGLVNEAGNFATRGNATVAGGLRNSSGATARVTAGSTLTATGGVVNQSGGDFFIGGRLVGDMINRGTLTQSGTLDGSLGTTGSTTLSGTVTGDLIYDGGTLVLQNGARIGRDLRLNANYSLGAGEEVTAGRTVVSDDTTLVLAGQLNGALLNHSTVEVRGNQARVTGQVENNATIDMSDNSTSGVLRVGGLGGAGTYRLDLNLRTMTSDRIEVRGGAASGNYYLDFNLIGRDTLPQRGARVTLIDVDDSFGSQNDFHASWSSLPAGSERIIYSVQRSDPDRQTGDLELVSQLNPAMGAIFGNVALVQSLIGSVVNRPTSPFVTSLAYEDTEKPCGVGSWGRAIGGHATASGRTNNGISNVETEVDASYYGMQVGTDFACFDGRYSGWNVTLGGLAGINRGSTSQPVYAIDPNDSQNLTSILTSYTSTDFEQRYVGLYATATKDRFQADLQYRLERTDFTIENDPLPGYAGLGLAETGFSSDAQTLSGSVSYAYPVGKTGWAVLPTMGFAWSKLSTDSIRFDDEYELIFKDSTRKIGFVGATVAKTFVDAGNNSALNAFATGTWYKDFADPTVSLFESDESSERLSTENLGAYGEISLGANWIKVLGPKSRGRQLSAGARIDARFGDQLDSVGVSGQFRWQF